MLSTFFFLDLKQFLVSAILTGRDNEMSVKKFLCSLVAVYCVICFADVMRFCVLGKSL